MKLDIALNLDCDKMLETILTRRKVDKKLCIQTLKISYLHKENVLVSRHGLTEPIKKAKNAKMGS